MEKRKYGFSNRSLKHRSQSSEYLTMVIDKTLSLGVIDFCLIESIRSKDKQNKYFSNGKSRVQWPDGKHNILKEDDKAKALDIVPVINGSLSWKKDHCLVLAGVILAVDASMENRLRWGGNWDRDGEPITDQDFQDLVHFEEAG
jgi:peptidoglycan L-alanyl-D-glutamate endopeptidase CwlK